MNNVYFYVVEILVSSLILFILNLCPSVHFQSYRSKLLFVLVNSIAPVLLFTAGPSLQSIVLTVIKGVGDSIMIPTLAVNSIGQSLVFAILPGILSAQLPLFGRTRKQMIYLSSFGAIVGATISDAVSWFFHWNEQLSIYELFDTSPVFPLICNIIGGSFVGLITGNNVYRVISDIKVLVKKDKYSLIRILLRTVTLGGLIVLSFIIFLSYWIFFYRIPVNVMFEFKCQQDCRYQFVPESLNEYLYRSASGSKNLPRPVENPQGNFRRGFIYVSNAKGTLTIAKHQTLKTPKNSIVLVDGYSFDLSVVKDLSTIHGMAYTVFLNSKVLNKTLWETIDPNVRGGIIGGLITLAGSLVVFLLSRKRKQPS
ncbi:MAG: hypothetical protein L7F78_01265 [Syntrophales bacterium LBB04]|nr:hypothetical protein [Syntrophales bacterium LBB04]